MTHAPASLDPADLPADRPRACAYLGSCGAVYTWSPAGRGSRTDSPDPRSREVPDGPLELLAVGLTSDDCAAVRRLWGEADSVAKAREAQRRYLEVVASGRARGIAAELRGVRRRTPPPGTLCGRPGASGHAFRLPDGTGWTGFAGPLPDSGQGWAWSDALPYPLTHVLARGLTLEQVRAGALVVSRAYELGGRYTPPAERAAAARSAVLAYLAEEGLA